MYFLATTILHRFQGKLNLHNPQLSGQMHSKYRLYNSYNYKLREKVGFSQTLVNSIIITIQYYSRSHVGAAPSHPVPSIHLLFSFPPVRLNPELHLYVATDPGVIPVSLICPFCGASSSLQTNSKQKTTLKNF